MRVQDEIVQNALKWVFGEKGGGRVCITGNLQKL